MSHQDDLDPNVVGFEFVKEGADWLAIFNPKVPRQMDVKLAHKFTCEKAVCSVKFSSDGDKIAVGSDGVVVLCDLIAGKRLTFPLDGSSDTRNYVRAVTFSPDGKYLVSGSEDKLIRIWDIQQGTLLHTIRGHRGEIYALDISSDGNLLASASGDRTVRVWDIQRLAGDSSDTLEKLCRVLSPKSAQTKEMAFTSVSISHNSHYVAAGSLDSTIRVWDLVAMPEDTDELEGAKLVDKLTGHEKSVYSVKFVDGLSPAGKGEALISGSLDKSVKRWEVGPFEKNGVRGASPDREGSGENGSTCLKTLKGHKDYVLATSAVREGLNYRAASSSRDGSVRLWDLKTGTAQFLIQGHKNTVTSVDLSSDGKQLATGSGDCEVRLWTYTIL